MYESDIEMLGSPMKVLQLYNQYRSEIGGEENVVQSTAAMIEKAGGRARLYQRSSRGLDESLSGRLRAFASGIYSIASRREVEKILRDDRPDIVHAHNLYPLLSPSVLVACRNAGVPVVLSLHNYLLTCPTAHHLCDGNVCERCTAGRSLPCVLNDCRGNRFESIAYALRNTIAHRRRYFLDNVDRYIALSDFARRKLIAAGFPRNRVALLPNWVATGHPVVDAGAGEYVAFSGRLRGEKGVDILLDAAARHPDIPIRIAGDGPLKTELVEQAPRNVTFVGRLDADALAAHYRGARMLVVPSRWYEMSPLAVMEAMSHGLPVVASRIGALPELVEDGVTGVLFESGNASDLASTLAALWRGPDRCRELGGNGRHKVENEYCEGVYRERLFAIYREAMRARQRARSRIRC